MSCGKSGLGQPSLPLTAAAALGSYYSWQLDQQSRPRCSNLVGAVQRQSAPSQAPRCQARRQAESQQRRNPGQQAPAEREREDAGASGGRSAGGGGGRCKAAHPPARPGGEEIDLGLLPGGDRPGHPRHPAVGIGVADADVARLAEQAADRACAARHVGGRSSGAVSRGWRAGGAAQPAVMRSVLGRVARELAC